jgi:hypothetical protein
MLVNDPINPTHLDSRMSKRIYKLVHDEARSRASEDCLNAPDGWVITVSESTRNLDQNAKLWAALSDISNQVTWHGRKLDPESWKHVFTSSIKKMDVVPNLEGTGFVALGLSTSKMTKSEFSQLIELIVAFAAEHDVKFSNEFREQ